MKKYSPFICCSKDIIQLPIVSLILQSSSFHIPKKVSKMRVSDALKNKLQTIPIKQERINKSYSKVTHDPALPIEGSFMRETLSANLQARQSNFTTYKKMKKYSPFHLRDDYYP